MKAKKGQTSNPLNHQLAGKYYGNTFNENKIVLSDFVKGIVNHPDCILGRGSR